MDWTATVPSVLTKKCAVSDQPATGAAVVLLPSLTLLPSMSMRPNARVLRDIAKRHTVHSNELLRTAYKYIARNTTLPSRVRYMAQLELNNFPAKSRPAFVKDRCIETSRGRGVFTEFGLCRVRICALLPQYQFRRKAVHHEIPGVEKASW